MTKKIYLLVILFFGLVPGMKNGEFFINAGFTTSAQTGFFDIEICGRGTTEVELLEDDLGTTYRTTSCTVTLDCDTGEETTEPYDCNVSDQFVSKWDGTGGDNGGSGGSGGGDAVEVVFDQNDALLCGYYPTVKVGNGYTGGNGNLGFTMTITSSAGTTTVPVLIGSSCFSVGGTGMNPALASTAISIAYNAAVTEVMYLVKYSIIPANSVSLRAALILAVSANMALLPGGSYSSGNCLGTVPKTTANYSCN